MSGLTIMRPTSIVVAGAGSSASIRLDGGVDFSAATSLSLNGVFTSDYDDYMIVYRVHLASGDSWFTMRLRASGSDASGSNYTYQELNPDNTTINAGRQSSQTNTIFGYISNTQRSAVTSYFYGPNLAQPTAGRTLNMYGQSSARLMDSAFTHSLSTAYDGFSMILNASNATGMVTVYGYAQ